MSFHITNNWCNITPASENGNHLVVFICRFLFISYDQLHSILLNRMNAVSTFIIPINIIFIIKPEPFLNYFKKPFCFWLISFQDTKCIKSTFIGCYICSWLICIYTIFIHDFINYSKALLFS